MEKVALKNQEVYINDKNFEKLMVIYSVALEKMKIKIIELEKEFNQEKGRNIVTNISSRIKSPQSIFEKMINKGYCFTYKSLIENINDIAGLRIVCLSEKDIYTIVKKISKLEEVNILKKKDYIKNPKKSGYSAYHIIVETPIYLEGKRVWVKVEIQIRTMAMDFWANLEHGVKYKATSKLSTRDSKLLKIYAKILSRINKSITKMYKTNFQYVE